MNVSTVTNKWHECFGSARPAGHFCRTALPDRWVRIHSLPESKRYPETEIESSEVLRRQNTAAQYALGEGSDCILFITQYGESRNWSDYFVGGSRYTAEFLALSCLSPEHLQSHENEQDGPLQFFATRQRWHYGAFDDLILKCAMGTAGPLLFANIEKCSAYAPYDGGADLFLADSDAACAARAMFQEWRSPNQSGL